MTPSSNPSRRFRAPARSRGGAARVHARRSVLFEREDVQPYECDGLSAYRQVPMVVALPENEGRGPAHPRRSVTRSACRSSRAARAPDFPAARCRSATACCSRSRSSCASSRSTRRRAPRACSPACAISRSRKPPRRYGLYYAPDPSSQIACTIGGNVAENSGGVHCLKYGLTVHNILKIRAITIEGEIVEIGGDGLDCAGLRSARADDRLRRHARGRHRSHGEAPAQARMRAGRDGRFRRRRESRRGGREHHRGRHHSRPASR